jgi:hypothetical protein
MQLQQQQQGAASRAAAAVFIIDAPAQVPTKAVLQSGTRGGAYSWGVGPWDIARDQGKDGGEPQEQQQEARVNSKAKRAELEREVLCL